MSTTDSIISKVWSFCTTLRDDGVGYGDYLEQLTYLIFLKLADEYGKAPYNRDVGVPTQYTWPELLPLKGAELEVHYVETLRELGNAKGMLGQIFTKAQNKIQDPAKLARLIEMVGSTDWVLLGSDTKGDIYEGILEKNAEDTKSGAGQYFTPRALISAMVECVAPEPNKTIADPACGTGGFFLAAYDYLVSHHQLNKDQKIFLKNDTFSGNEIVPGTRRLCLMNLFLHNIGEIDGDGLVSSADALVAQGQQSVDYVLANPPFGKKSSMTVTNAATYYTILVTTSASGKFKNLVGNFQQVLLGDLEEAGCVIPNAVTLNTCLMKGNPRTLVGVMNQQVHEIGFMLEGEDSGLVDMQKRCNAMLRGQPSYVVPAQEFTKKTIAKSPFVSAENMKGMEPDNIVSFLN